MKKRLLSTLLVLALVFSMVPNVTVHAAISGGCGENVTWSLSEDGTLTISGTGAMTNYSSSRETPWYANLYSIVDVVIKKGVTTIGDYAFYECYNLNSVTIPNSVTTIGKYAFYCCNGLTDIVIPNSVTSIGDSVFSECDSLISVNIPGSISNISTCAFYDCYSLSSVTIGNGVKTIGNSAFYHCYQLSSVTIPNSVSTISYSAFNGCGLTSISIPYGVITIGDYAFENCWSTSVTIPDSLTSVGADAFAGCSDQAYNIYDNGKYLGNDNNPYLLLCTSASPYNVTSVEIHPNTKIISGNAFMQTRLTTVTIPDSVIAIGDNAFSHNFNLSTVSIGKNVETIGYGAFQYCEGITSISIPDSVTDIGRYAFSGTALTTVTIPAGVKTIGSAAFAYCDNLTGIWVDTQNRNYCNDSSGVLYNKDKTALIQAPGSFEGAYVIPDGVITIEDSAFSNCGLSSVTIPVSVTAIGTSAFSNCASLTTLTIPDSVTTIGEHAFAGCNKLTSITIPESVITIGYDPFVDCTNLANVYYGGTKVRWRILFQNEYGYVDVLDATIHFAKEPDNPDELDYHCTLKNGEITVYMYQGNGRGDITIPSAFGGFPVTTIGYGVFEYCSLTSVTIPDGVTEIQDYAFYECYNLTSVTIPDSVTTIGNDAFCYCNNLTICGYAGSCAQQYAQENNILFVVLERPSASNGEEIFGTLQAALDAYETGVIQLLADADSVTVSKNVVVDLNGFSIASVTANDAKLTVLDSKTADYTVADGIYGKIAAINGTVTPAEGYIAITEEGGTSYHKVTLDIADMTLRGVDAGIYYNCIFNGDEKVKEQVTTYGVALSLRGTPVIGKTGTEYSVFHNFDNGSNTPSTLLKNVMKETCTEQQNKRRADMQVYGRAYIQIGDTYIYGETVSRSFRQQVELADEAWDTLIAEQKTELQEMYRTFQDDMADWKIPNMKESL